MKLQTAVVAFALSFLLLAAASTFYLIRKSEYDTALSLGSLYTDGSGFLITPRQMYAGGNFSGPSAEYLPVVSEYIRGKITDVVFTSSRFADYTTDYKDEALLTLTLESESGNTTSLTISSPGEMLLRKCASKSDCPPFSAYNNGEEQSVQFSYDYAGTLKAGDEVILYHEIVLGSQTDPVFINESYEVYATRYE